MLEACDGDTTAPDGDRIYGSEEICPSGDDRIDADNDGTADFCDTGDDV